MRCNWPLPISRRALSKCLVHTRAVCRAYGSYNNRHLAEARCLLSDERLPPVQNKLISNLARLSQLNQLPSYSFATIRRHLVALRNGRCSRRRSDDFPDTAFRANLTRARCTTYGHEFFLLPSASLRPQAARAYLTSIDRRNSMAAL